MKVRANHGVAVPAYEARRPSETIEIWPDIAPTEDVLESVVLDAVNSDARRGSAPVASASSGEKRRASAPAKSRDKDGTRSPRNHTSDDDGGAIIASNDHGGVVKMLRKPKSDKEKGEKPEKEKKHHKSDKEKKEKKEKKERQGDEWQNVLKSGMLG